RLDKIPGVATMRDPLSVLRDLSQRTPLAPGLPKPYKKHGRAWTTMRVVSQLLLATLLALAAFAGPATAAKQPESITVGFSNIAGDELGLWVAVDEGFFTSHGLNVNAQLLAGGANTVA